MFRLSNRRIDAAAVDEKKNTHTPTPCTALPNDSFFGDSNKIFLRSLCHFELRLFVHRIWLLSLLLLLFFPVRILFASRNKVFCRTIIVQLCDDDYGRITHTHTHTFVGRGCEILLFFGRFVDASFDTTLSIVNIFDNSIYVLVLQCYSTTSV